MMMIIIIIGLGTLQPVPLYLEHILDLSLFWSPQKKASARMAFESQQLEKKFVPCCHLLSPCFLVLDDVFNYVGCF